MALGSLQHPECGSDYLAGVFVTSALDTEGYEAVEFVGQIDVSGGHGYGTLLHSVDRYDNLCDWQRLPKMGIPPRVPRFGIIGLGENFRQIFGFKGLRDKVFLDQ